MIALLFYQLMFTAAAFFFTLLLFKFLSILWSLLLGLFNRDKL